MVLPVLLTTAAAVAAAGGNLCYSVQFHGASQRNFVLKPVTGFPASHVLVDRTICGNHFNAGDPIPGGTQLWSNRGAANDESSSCEETTGSGLFYAYNSPNGASSNTGFEQDKAVIVYFVVDADGDLSVVLTFDRPRNGNGGRVEMNIDAPELRGKELTFDLRDDNHEPRCGGGHCQWNSATGKVEGMRWDWFSCCTDGMVLGNLPSSEGFQIPFNFDVLNGIDTFRMGSWNSETNDIEFEDLSAEDVLSSGISVVVDTCGAYCSEKANCGECSLDPECGWCEESQECMMAADGAQCSGNDETGSAFNTGGDCCAACVAAATFDECGAVAGCAWDHATSECISVAGTFNTPDFMTCQASDYLQVIRPGVPFAPCPGRVPTVGTLESWCSGNGHCDWAAKTCDCDSTVSGFGGAGCEVACPVSDGKICGGHGTCGSDGTCTCNCGYRGAGCDAEHCLAQCETEATDPSEYCVIGDCETRCGKRLGGDACSGSDVGGSCVCAEGWFGEQCDQRCPGVNADGTGAICGGAGECTAQGTCVCSGCNSVAADGTCQPLAVATCSNYGSSFCNETSQANECECTGQWTGPSCDLCACPGVECNTVSGKCAFTECAADEYQRTPGSFAADTDCAPVAPPCDVSSEFEMSPPTRTSNRVCGQLTVCGADQYETTANTASTDRACADLTVCSNAAGTFQRKAPTAYADRECGVVTDCAPDAFEVERVTETSNRQCRKHTVCVADVSFQEVAPTATSDRVCQAYSLECNPGCGATTALDAGAGFELEPATPISDRVCGTVSAPCAGDTVEVALPTCSSDRVCVPVDDCAAAPCQNGATCTDLVLDYACACAFPYAGKDCAFFDACSVPGVCSNGGSCTATADGAVCACTDGFFGACCTSTDDTGETVEGDVCMDLDTARSQGDDDGAGGAAASMTVPIVGAVLGALTAFLIVGLTMRRRKEARDTADLKEQLDKELASAGGSLANPTFLAKPGYSTVQVANGGEYANYAEPGAGKTRAAVDAIYAGTDGTDDVYAMGAAGADSENTYDSAVAVGAGGQPADMYALATTQSGEPVYAQGNAADDAPTLYGLASEESGGTYAVATMEAAAEPTYGLASPEDAVYDQGAAEPTYGLASPEDAVYDQGAAEPTYGLASPEDAVYDQGAAEPTYGLTDQENTYGLADDDQGSTYGVSVRAQYSNASDMYSNGVEVAPGVVLSGTMARSLMKAESVYDNGVEPEIEAEDPRGPPGEDYLETEPHHRMPSGVRSGRRESFEL